MDYNIYTSDDSAVSTSLRKVTIPFIAIGIYASVLALPSIESNIINIPKGTLSFYPSNITIASTANTGGRESIQTTTQKQAHPLEKFIGTWQGDDFDEVLDLVYNSRSKF